MRSIGYGWGALSTPPPTPAHFTDVKFAPPHRCAGGGEKNLVLAALASSLRGGERRSNPEHRLRLDCFVELVIGPAPSGRTRWLAMTKRPRGASLRPSYG